jgi:hypothetical protein
MGSSRDLDMAKAEFKAPWTALPSAPPTRAKTCPLCAIFTASPPTKPLSSRMDNSKFRIRSE